MEVFMNKIKLVCTISIITIIGGTLFGCNNQSSKQTVNDTSNSMISDSDSSKPQQIVDDTKANEDIKTTDITYKKSLMNYQKRRMPMKVLQML